MTKIELNIKYSVETEIDRIKFTCANKEFYKKHSYKIILPAGCSLNSLCEEELKDVYLKNKIKKELDLKIGSVLIPKIEKNGNYIQKIFKI